MILAIVFLIFAIIIFLLLLGYADKNGRWIAFFGGLCIVTMIASCEILHNIIAPTPSAIDVYRGKTTLEITYRDSVAVDSVVIYKVK